MDWKFIVGLVSGIAVILSLANMIIGAVMKLKLAEVELKKANSEKTIKELCEGRFTELEDGASERHDKLIRLEGSHQEILRRLDKIEQTNEAHTQLLTQILRDMPKRENNHKGV